MGKKTFTADLSVSGLNALKKQLLQYRDDLPIKCKQLVSRLLQSGVEVAETNISKSPLGKYVTVSTNISSDKMGCNGILLAKGQVKEQDGYAPFSILLAIEFGAGVHFNPTQNPLVGSKFPYGVGTFPGQTHAYDDMWWYWNEKEQKWMPTSAVNAVKNLSKVNMAGFDTSKMTEIANSVSNLATKLSGVSEIESTVTRVVGSLARLSNSGQYIGNVTTEFPKLGKQVVKLVRKLSSANAIDISITKVVEGIAKLANAGKRVGETVANLKKLGKGVMNLLKKLQNAPQINSNVANTIQGLGNLASSGSRISTVSDRASTSTKKLGNALSSLKDKLKSAHKSSKGFVSSIGMFYAKFFLVIRAVKKFGQAIGSAQDYIEEFNYFSVALDKVGKDSANQFKKAGYNSAEEYAGSFRKRFGKLQKQLTGYDVDTNTGDATNTFSHNLGLDLTEVMNYNAAIAQITNSAGMLGETSIDSAKALTMLSADWASLANLDTADVMQNFQSGLVGQSRALYKYGIDITSAGLAQTAMNHGITESIKNLSQQSKMQLRVLTMLEQSKVAYADLARTINQPANQLRMLQAGFKKLSLTIGSLFMPIIQKL